MPESTYRTLCDYTPCTAGSREIQNSDAHTVKANKKGDPLTSPVHAATIADELGIVKRRDRHSTSQTCRDTRRNNKYLADSSVNRKRTQIITNLRASAPSVSITPCVPTRGQAQLGMWRGLAILCADNSYKGEK